MEMERWQAVVLIVGILLLLVYMVLLERRLNDMDEYTVELLKRIDELEEDGTFEEIDKRRTEYAPERANEKEDENSQEKGAQERAKDK